MPFAEINGLRLFYHEQGPNDPDAPTIVLVHGTQGNASLWAGLIDELSDRFRCAALNHRGRAPSESPDDPSLYSIEQFADDQAALIEQRGYRNITMMGWSLGVRTTLAYLHRHGTERVGQAILVAGPPSPNFGGQPLTPPDQDAPPREVWGQEFRASTEACWEGSQHSRSDLRSGVDAVRDRHPGRDLPRTPRPDLSARGGRVHGSGDSQCDAEDVRESGHAPLVTESERFVEETVAFIERCEEARSAVDAD